MGKCREVKTGGVEAAVVVTRLALVADEEIFEQFLGFMGVAVVHQLRQPHGEQHLRRGKWEAGEVGGE